MPLPSTFVTTRVRYSIVGGLQNLDISFPFPNAGGAENDAIDAAAWDAVLAAYNSLKAAWPTSTLMIYRQYDGIDVNGSTDVTPAP